MGAKMDNLVCAVLSGKGGTGKTTVAVNLAAVSGQCQYVDCDVEEPNGAIFLQYPITAQEEVGIKVPVIDPHECIACGRCVEACAFNALAQVREKVLIFAQLCHSCGLCTIVCPTKAISEQERIIGVVEQGQSGTVSCLQGRLAIGEPSGVPIIKALKGKLAADRLVILDCPPGSACAVVEAVADADFGVLVTEPTPFGLHDLQLAVRLLRQLRIPCGVVINRTGDNDRLIADYCQQEHLPVLCKIPFDREIAALSAAGELLVGNARYAALFRAWPCRWPS